MEYETLRAQEPVAVDSTDWGFNYENSNFDFDRRKSIPRKATADVQLSNDFDFGESDFPNNNPIKMKGSIRKPLQESRRKNSQQFEVLSSPQSRKESKGKIDEQQFSIEIKTIMSRIQSYHSQIKEKVQAQKDFNQSIIAINMEQNENFDFSSQDNGPDGMPVNDISMIRHHDSFRQQDKSAILSPVNKLFQQEVSFRQDHKVEEQICDPFREEDSEQPITIERSKFEKILLDLETKHQAEKFALRQEALVYQKVIQGLISKFKLLQEQVYQKDRELMQLDRLCLMTERLRYENEHLRLENMTLSSKVELMKQIMMEFDTQRLEEDQEDKYLLEQLLTENQSLQNLLRIHRSGGMNELNEVSERLTLAEQELTILQESEDLRRRENELSPVTEMPENVKDIMADRIGKRQDERKEKEQMRKLAEEEILKELKMAEQFFQKNQFEQTRKGGYNFYDEDDDLEEREVSPPTVSGANDDGNHRQENSSPSRQLTWEEMMDQQSQNPSPGKEETKEE